MASQVNGNESSPLLRDHAYPAATEDEEPTTVSGTHHTPLALKIAATMVSFTTLGLFNSSVGAVLPLMSQHYQLTDLNVSLLFLAAPIGYILAAQCSNALHYHFGQRGVAAVGPVFQIVSNVFIALHPRFGWVLFAFGIQGLGMGLLDGSWCAWAGNMDKANTISGLLHGSYSAGGAGGPFLVTVITGGHNRPWYLWYYFLVMQSITELIVLVYAFRRESASVYRQSKQLATADTKVNTQAILRHRANWLCALYFLTYVGTETAISGWVVSFMLRNRDATPYVASLASSGYWIGMAGGRLLLGFGTDRIGVRRATVFYFLLAVILETLFAALASPVSSVILMTSLGFIMGPLFPSGIVVLTRLLPSELHIASVSFVSSLGQVGGAFHPFAIGAVIQSMGIGIFRYAILLQTVLALFVWILFSRLRSPTPSPRSEATQDASRED